MYGQGISKAGDVLDCAVEEKIVEKLAPGIVMLEKGLDKAVKT